MSINHSLTRLGIMLTGVLRVPSSCYRYQPNSIFRVAWYPGVFISGVLGFNWIFRSHLVLFISCDNFRDDSWFCGSKFTIYQRLRNLWKVTRAFEIWLLQMRCLSYAVQSSLLLENALQNLWLFWFAEFVRDSIAWAGELEIRLLFKLW